ncbi:hypothetical protein [Zestomonas carbonaria]|uniref:hypothetical protein n=1 Tax=Zestomonas carbonaria TaxID=2762745 RepID=UPI0016574072|nr:hypothetical protein [Pseudomonas carbonaria]
MRNVFRLLGLVLVVILCMLWGNRTYSSDVLQVPGTSVSIHAEMAKGAFLKSAL